jgi:hypothetical protein
MDPRWFATLFSFVALIGPAGSVSAQSGPSTAPREPLGDLWICASYDGGQIVTDATGGQSVWWGLKGVMEPFKYQVGTGAFTVYGWSPVRGSCVYAGTYSTNQDGVMITETSPRDTSGIGISAFNVEKARIIDSDRVARTIKVRLAERINFVTFAHQRMCAVNPSGSSPSSVGGICQEGRDGLAEINVIQADNFVVTAESFAVGTKGVVRWDAVKANPDEIARCTLQATSVSGVKATLSFEY